MRITIRDLRKIVQEEVQRNLRLSAGFFGGGLSNQPSDGSELPPPGLGEDEETSEENGKEKKE